MIGETASFAAQRVGTRGGALVVIAEGAAGLRLPIVLIHGGGMDRTSISWARTIGPRPDDKPV